MEPVLVIEVHKAGKDFPCLVSLIQACTIPKWSHNGVFNLVSQHRAVLPSYACKNIKKKHIGNHKQKGGLAKRAAYLTNQDTNTI